MFSTVKCARFFAYTAIACLMTSGVCVNYAWAADATGQGSALPESGTNGGTSEVQNFVQRMGQEAIMILTDTNKSYDDKASGFHKILLQDFDVKGIGSFLVGSHYGKFTEEEKQQYEKLLPQYIVHLYLRQFHEYQTNHMKSEDFKVTRTIQRNPQKPADGFSSDTMIKVSRSGGNPIDLKVSWRVFKTSQGYKILDVFVNGLSMSQTKKAEFQSLIKQGGTSKLLEELNNKVNAPAPRA